MKDEQLLVLGTVWACSVLQCNAGVAGETLLCGLIGVVEGQLSAIEGLQHGDGGRHHADEWLPDGGGWFGMADW